MQNAQQQAVNGSSVQQEQNGIVIISLLKIIDTFGRIPTQLFQVLLMDTATPTARTEVSQYASASVGLYHVLLFHLYYNNSCSNF